MTEREQALEIAAKVLEKNSTDPNDINIVILARQLVRSQEEILKLTTVAFSKRL